MNQEQPNTETIVSSLCRRIATLETLLLTTKYRQQLKEASNDVASPSTSPVQDRGTKAPNAKQFTFFFDDAVKSATLDYNQFFMRFQKAGIDYGVYAHFSLLLKKVMLKRKNKIDKKNFRSIMAACLFISIKFVVDRFVLFIDDFVRLSGMNRKNIEVLETGILVNILGFDVNFSEQEIIREL